MVSTITWIATHLPTPEGWKAELTWLADHSGHKIRHRSGKVQQPTS